MPPTLTDYTWALGETGTVLNTDSMGFPFVDITKVSGLDTAPLRTTTSEHQGVDGTYVDTPYMSMRTVVLTGTLYTDPADPDTLLNQLRADYNNNTVRPFYFKLPNQTLKYVNAQGGGLQYDVDSNRRTGITPVQFTVLAGDPYIYDYPISIIGIGSPTVITVGTSFNMSFNVGFGGGAATSSGTVTNNGTHNAYPIITLTGPLTNPSLFDSNGISMNFSITLAASDILVVDCRNRSVVLNGQVSRRSALSGIRWFAVPPASTDTIYFGAQNGTGTATVQLSNTYY